MYPQHFEIFFSQQKIYILICNKEFAYCFLFTGIRDKSPVRSRTRGRNSPVVVEQHEETLENKRTTRSAKTKGIN